MIHQLLKRDHPSLSLSTVYQTLEIFIRRGLIRRVTNAGGKLRVDGTAQDHDHAVCRSCGEVFDIDRGLIKRPAAPRVLPNGMEVMNLHVEYEVRCARCAPQWKSLAGTDEVTSGEGIVMRNRERKRKVNGGRNA
jgi:Fe2+ or Zn2+ uptake regulation protein